MARGAKGGGATREPDPKEAQRLAEISKKVEGRNLSGGLSEEFLGMGEFAVRTTHKPEIVFHTITDEMLSELEESAKPRSHWDREILIGSVGAAFGSVTSFRSAYLDFGTTNFDGNDWINSILFCSAVIVSIVCIILIRRRSKGDDLPAKIRARPYKTHRAVILPEKGEAGHG